MEKRNLYKTAQVRNDVPQLPEVLPGDFVGVVYQGTVKNGVVHRWKITGTQRGPLSIELIVPESYLRRFVL